MANELETLSFSIQDTMELGGRGNQSMLEDLLSPETITAKTDEIEKITPKKEEKKDGGKPKVEKPDLLKEKKELEEKEKKKEEESESLLNSFLSDDGADDKKEGEGEGEEVKPEGKEKEGEENKVEKDDNRFSALAKDLLTLGVFSKDEGEEYEIKTPEEFLERFNFEKKKGAIEVVDKFIGQFGEEYQEAFDAIFVKGVDPKEYFGTYNNIQDFSTLDLKLELNQIAVLRQSFADSGMDEADIATEIERIKNYGDLETVATRHHKVLLKKQTSKLEQLKQDSENKLKQIAAVKNQYVKNVQTILQDKLKTGFDGIPLNPQLASEIQDFLITDKYKTPSGETLTEFDRTILDLKRPENHAMKVKLALLLKILEKDPTLSTIQKAGVTKKTDTLFGELARQTSKGSVKSDKDKEEKPRSWFL
jgi:hypothetical protein